MKDKIFHDTVHGNIRIPESYCDSIIDTLLFQRLRRVEQSSVRSLYPCARHDRFIHSIGVFYIGSMLVEWLQSNVEEDLFKELDFCWHQSVESYKLACLLHDVGHAPFSHTFEHYYDVNEPNKLDDKLCEVIKTEEFKKDLTLMAPAKPHEKVSAYLLASEFKDAVVALDGVVEYGVRMIIGCLYNNDKSIEKQFINCLIHLLHGEVDADRLDYAVRDQWAAGFTSARIQIERLLRSILIIKDPDTGKLKLCFTKNAINQIESLAQIKDFQQRWVFCHQNVKYDQHVLKQAIEKVAFIYGSKEGIKKEDALKKIFNFNCFFDPNYQIEGQSLYLLSDDTILQMLRQTFTDNEYAQEWLSRKYTKKPIWKTAAEYESIFKKNKSSLTVEKITSKLDEMGFDKNKDYTVIDADYKHFAFLEGSVWIFINNMLIDVNNYIPLAVDKPSQMYYVYLSNEKMGLKEDTIKNLKGIV